MPRCSHTYADSSQCRRIVSAQQRYCYSHDPLRAGERRRNAARGGKAKASGELGRVKARLHTLADMVEEGRRNLSDMGNLPAGHLDGDEAKRTARISGEVGSVGGGLGTKQRR
jgi:hypothetical protein